MTLCELKLQMNDEFPQLDITESSIGNCVPYALTIQSSVWPVAISLIDDQGTVRMWIDRCPLIEPYGTSILPYDDCCVVFASRHPVTRPKFSETAAFYRGLEIEEELRKALRAAEVRKFGA